MAANYLRLSDVIWFAILWNSAMFSHRVQSTFMEGKIDTSETWTFLARFCFMSEKGELDYNVTFPKAYQPITLLLYYDEPNQWPAVYKKGLSCTEMTSPPHILVENNQAIELQAGEFWSGCEEQAKSDLLVCQAKRTFKSARERWWYMALSRCQNSTLQGIHLEYSIHMINGMPNELFRREFSADEFNILEVDIAFLLAMCVLLVLAIVAAVYLRNQQMLHTSYKMYLTSLSFEVFYLFIMCIAYGTFAKNGVPNEGLRTFGRISEVASILIFILMLLLMGKGFTITRGRISTSGSIKIAIFMTLYVLTYAILFFYQAVFFDPGVVLYLYDSPPGYGILVLRLLAWFYFSYACFFTIKHYPEKSKFYYPFYIFYTIWFLIGPLFVIIAFFAFPKYMRSKVINAIDQSIMLLAQAFLLFLTRPSNSNKNFPYHVRTSQIGILRSDQADKELDNYPQYPYAPSSNVSYGSEAGPDFTSLFSVARTVYDTKGNQSDSNSSSPTQNTELQDRRIPSALHPPREHDNPSEEPDSSDKVPIDRFPHERTDPFVTTRR